MKPEKKLYMQYEYDCAQSSRVTGQRKGMVAVANEEDAVRKAVDAYKEFAAPAEFKMVERYEVEHDGDVLKGTEKPLTGIIHVIDAQYCTAQDYVDALEANLQKYRGDKLSGNFKANTDVTITMLENVIADMKARDLTAPYMVTGSGDNVSYIALDNDAKLYNAQGQRLWPPADNTPEVAQDNAPSV